MSTIIGIIIAYLIGSISCAIIVAKFMKLPDPRKEGSGNAGATNVLRIGGKQAAIWVLIGDLIKGVIAVLIGRIIGDTGVGLGLVAFAAVVGHIFPVYFKFKGGKGVATMIGGLLALSLAVGIGTVVVWLIVAAASRYASLASMIAAIAAPIFTLFFGDSHFFIPVLFITVLVIWKHMENIERLRNGKESKIELK
ncbi:MAG: glycerol-3-phosphate 1-O-acyltransferase PlsY [Coxiellaceae bacterium]|nr:glycerol-3-phosphate 1-O-acyltransferase PlsY [Coxiellaceae bacterium]